MTDQPTYAGMGKTAASSTDLKFQVSREGFTAAVAWAAKALPTKSLAPVLSGVLLRGDDNGLTISGYDYDVSCEAQTSAEITSPGSVLVSGRLLSSIAQALPNKPVHFGVNDDDSRVSLTCGSAKFTLPTMTLQDYPLLPQLPEDTGSLAGDVFSEAINQVAVAASKEDSTPMLTGVRIEIDGDKLVFIATDRFRLAVRELTWSPISPDVRAELLVPAKTLQAAAQAGSDGSAVWLQLGEKNSIGKQGIIGVGSENRRSTSRLLDAEYPEYGQLLPSEYTAVATVTVADVAEAVKRCALVSDRGSQIRLAFGGNSLRLAANDDLLGQAEEDIDIEFSGDPITIAFNPQYLSDGLTALHAQKATFGFTTPRRPAVLQAASDVNLNGNGSTPFPAVPSEYKYVLMPVRMPG